MYEGILPYLNSYRNKVVEALEDHREGRLGNSAQPEEFPNFSATKSEDEEDETVRAVGGCSCGSRSGECLLGPGFQDLVAAPS